MKDPNLSKNLIILNGFWVDLAVYLAKNNGDASGFLSENFIFSNTCHAEMICALSFNDL
jgi:hypothetical protein